MAGGNAFGNDRAAGVFADVNHLRCRVGLLVVLARATEIEFTNRIVTLENTAVVFPGDRRPPFPPASRKS